MPDWIKVSVDVLESDSMTLALSETPFAANALLWLLTRAGKHRGDSFPAGETAMRSAAIKLRISPEDFALGLYALCRADLLTIEDGVARIHNWEKYQSKYMYDKKREQQKLPPPGPAVKVEPTTVAQPATATADEPTQPAQKTKKPAGGGEIPFEKFPKIDSPEFREQFAKWLAYRVSVKHNRLKNPAAMLAKLEPFGVETAIAALRESEANEWLGVFPDTVHFTAGGRNAAPPQIKRVNLNDEADKAIIDSIF